MESKITYLLGAGASKETLPIVNEIPRALSLFLDEINQDMFKLPKDKRYDDLGIPLTKREIQDDFVNSMNWLIKNSASHSSVDTFAKKLFITRNSDLIKLKTCLSIFFIYTQLKLGVDKRYDSFIASLISAGSIREMLPSNLNVLSWNYDFQFEKAISFYRGTKSLLECQNALNVSPADITKNEGSFSLFKLNGTTGFYKTDFKDVVNVIDNLTTPIDNSLMDNLIKYYAALTNHRGNYQSMMHFAWENDIITEKVISEAIKTTSDTTTLIVVGYSFPFFNREIDRKILRSMTKLRNVYFQAPGKEARNYIDRFQAIRTDTDILSMIPITDVIQFFLPPEL